MKRLRIVFLSVVVLLVAGIAVIFVDDAPPDVSHLAPIRDPEMAGDNPLAKDSPFMSLPIVLPEGVRYISELTDSIKRKSSNHELARQIVKDNADVLKAIDDALEIDTWGGDAGRFSRVLELLYLKIHQGVVEEADGAPDRGVLRDLEAAALAAHLDDRPSGTLTVFGSASSRSVALRVTTFPSRIAQVTDPEILAQAVSKLESIRLSPDKLSLALKSSFEEERMMLRKPNAKPQRIRMLKAMGHDWKVNFFKVNRTTAELARYFTKAIDPIVPFKDRSTPNLPELSGFSLNFGGDAYVKLIAVESMEMMIGEWIHYYVGHEALIAFVAVRHYEVVEGVRPSSLQDLVPRYLEAVPMDGYDGEPLRYDAAKGWIYSVGKDLVDNGGDAEPGQFQSATDPTFFFEG